MNLKALIVDDEPSIGHYLKMIIEAVPGVYVTDVVSSGNEALKTMEIFHPQVIFLDIDMPQMNGLELARYLTEKYQDLYIIFATAYPDYALEAFELYSFDYILKPFNEERIKKTVRKLRDQIQPGVSNILPAEIPISIETHKQEIFLRPGKILYVESSKPGILIKTLNDTYMIRSDMYTYERKLEPYGFYRCHRSYLVNLAFIKEISNSGRTYQLVLTSGEKILLSRQKVKVLKDKLHNL
ncbi:MAG: LytTR family DNA-binding domain-containing protein [Syntrophomonas sp.]